MKPTIAIMSPGDMGHAVGAVLRQAAEKGLALAREKLASNDYDLVILDEVLGAVGQGQLDLDAVLDVVRGRPRSVSVLLMLSVAASNTAIVSWVLVLGKYTLPPIAAMLP